MSKISIIIPVYFNEDTIPLLYEDLHNKVLDKIGEYEIVMVDDGSGDKSWIKIKQLYEKDNKIKAVKLSRNFGSHAAILAGLANCTGDCAIIKAADLQEESTLILEMYESWKRGNHVVLAAREDREERFFQKLFPNLYYKLVRKMISPQMPKGGFDIFLIDKKVIQILTLLDEVNSAITLQILWSGFKTDTVSYIRHERICGKSKWTLTKKMKLVFDSVMSFSYVPIRAMTFVGVAFFTISIIWAAVILLKKLFVGIEIQGWTTLILLLLCTSGLIMLMLGILGEYIWRTFDAARKRPPYIIEEMDGDYE